MRPGPSPASGDRPRPRGNPRTQSARRPAAAGRGPRTRPRPPRARATRTFSSGPLGQRHDGELYLLAALDVVLRDLVVAPHQLLLQQPVVENVALRLARRGFLE